jgi:uncharacterized phiE125 gp8 family phage protein
MISTDDLKDWMKAEDSDLPTLRSLEEAAIKAIEKMTGRYLGVTAAVTETIRFRGFPLALANDPIGGVITTLEQWDGSAYSTVAATDYYVWGSFVFSEGVWESLTAPSRFRVTYQAGYTVDPLDQDVWDAPADLKQAVKLLVGHWFENREAVVVGTITSDVKMSVEMLVAPHTRVAV